MREGSSYSASIILSSSLSLWISFSISLSLSLSLRERISFFFFSFFFLRMRKIPLLFELVAISSPMEQNIFFFKKLGTEPSLLFFLFISSISCCFHVKRGENKGCQKYFLSYFHKIRYYLSLYLTQDHQEK